LLDRAGVNAIDVDRAKPYSGFAAAALTLVLHSDRTAADDPASS
jgi:hypothetical protein